MSHQPSHQVSRRQFVAASAGITASALAAAQASGGPAQAEGDSKPLQIKPGATILLQGDSITDAGRKRDIADANSQPALGNGYAWLAAAALLVDHVDDELNIFNRGVSGNKVFQLDERWQTDCLDLKPDVLSILIGVNDFAHAQKGDYDGTVDKYETDYLALVKRTKEALPELQLVICEPFLIRSGNVTDSWFVDFAPYRAAARKVADEFGAAFVPFQAMFDAAAKIAPPERWAGDGVHPSADGAALMAHTWRSVVGA